MKKWDQLRKMVSEILVQDHTVGYAFFELKLHRIEANIMCENERSKKLFTDFGFRLEGMSKNYLYINGAWRDHFKYALTREDWNKVL